MGRVFVVWLQLILLPALYGAKKKRGRKSVLWHLSYWKVKSDMGKRGIKGKYHSFSY